MLKQVLQQETKHCVLNCSSGTAGNTSAVRGDICVLCPFTRGNPEACCESSAFRCWKRVSRKGDCFRMDPETILKTVLEAGKKEEKEERKTCFSYKSSAPVSKEPCR